ncbi:MAG: M48 family metallopeptidase [Alphaproteobacteria bacterium]|nr:M48 family metallopeptidase [Alphaproteobacteria bacterium]
MAAYGLYTHIASNRRRSILLTAGLFFFFYLLIFAGALLGEASAQPGYPAAFYVNLALADLKAAFPFATIGVVVWMAIAYFFHQRMIDALTGGREVIRTEQPRLYNALENLCISRGIAMPKLKVMDDPALNAFATGLNPRQYSVTVTTGLLDVLSDAEIEAVLGHELTHIRNGDVRLMVIAVIIAGMVGFLSEMLFRIFQYGPRSGSSSDDRKGAGIIMIVALALVVVAWVSSFLVRLALSRSREFLADAGSIELTKNPDAMISALRKIEGRGELPGATSAVMEMCIDNPREGFSDLFSTHPSVQARVNAIVKFAGGHDPGPLRIEQRDETPELPQAPAAHDDPTQPPSLPGTPSGPPIAGAATGPDVGPDIGPWGNRTGPAPP